MHRGPYQTCLKVDSDPGVRMEELFFESEGKDFLSLMKKVGWEVVR